MYLRKNKLRGSVLVFTLIVLAVLLSATLSAALVVVIDKNSSQTTEKSIVPFQLAEGAAENILKRIYKNRDATLDQLASNLHGTGSASGKPSCSNGTISGALPSSAGTYEVTLYDNDGNELECNGPGYSTCAEWRTKAVSLVSTATYARTTRSVSVGIEPDPACP